MTRTQAIPAAIRQQKEQSEALLNYRQVIGKKAKCKEQEAHLIELNELMENCHQFVNEVGTLSIKAAAIPSLDRRAKFYCDVVLPACEELRKVIDELESRIDDQFWPLPKYRELLFMV